MKRHRFGVLLLLFCWFLEAISGQQVHRKRSLFFIARPANLGVPVSLSKPQHVYEGYIFGFNAQVTLVRPFTIRQTNATNVPSSFFTPAAHRLTYQLKSTLDECLSGPRYCQSNRPGWIWEDSCRPEPPKGSMTPAPPPCPEPIITLQILRGSKPSSP